MRVLVLCDRFPASYQDGLTLRLLHYIRRLNARHRFDLVCFDGVAETPEARALFDQVWTFPRPARDTTPGWRAAVSGWSADALYPFSPALHAFLQHTLAPEGYDLVWDAACCLAPHLPPRWQRVPYFGDLVDDMILTLTREFGRATGWGRRARLLKYLWMNWAFERKYLNRAAMCSVVSEDDARTLRLAAPKARVAVVQNGVDIDYFAPADLPPQPRTLVFEGSMAFGPNVDAACHLVEDILPRVRAVMPDVQLSLVGRDPAPAVQALAGAGVVVTGSVPDVRPYLQSAAVFVCPLRFGAGIKNKILQAWSMGKAVVATPVSVGGLPGGDGDHALIRSAPDDIAEAVLRLCAAPDEALALGQRARQCVVQAFSWESKTREFEAAMLEAARGRA